MKKLIILGLAIQLLSAQILTGQNQMDTIKHTVEQKAPEKPATTPITKEEAGMAMCSAGTSVHGACTDGCSCETGSCNCPGGYEKCSCKECQSWAWHENKPIAQALMWFALAAFIIGLILVVYRYPEIVKDINKKNNGIIGTNRKEDLQTVPYSFARSQGVYWTALIIPVIIYDVFHRGSFSALKESTLILLIISYITTLSGSMIDKSEIKQGFDRHQENPHVSFFEDILTDANGFNLHRFQAFIFNLIFGGLFIYTYSTTHHFLDINSTGLFLLGLSQATYISFKSQENGTHDAKIHQGTAVYK